MTGALASRRCWVFDLDGTLTVARHDFGAMKRDLGLPPDQALLEAARARPPEERARLLGAIEAWEIEHADRAEVRPGAAELLDALRARGTPIGVLTRNARPAALRTLEVAGLAGYFAPEAVVGRDCAAPKPAPDGLYLVAARLGQAAGEAAMVGDYRFDLESARAAGALAVWLDAERAGTYRHLADLVVHSLPELLSHASAFRTG